jgi:predicted membrane-bound spermidine synthase
MPSRLRLLHILFALSGFCGLIYESIWTHYLKLFVGHAAFAQTLVLAVFMGGMGLGAALAARLSSGVRNLLWAYAAAELVIGVMALGFHSTFVTVTDWAYATLLPATCTAETVCWTQGLLATVLIAPQSVLLGTTFPLMTGGILRIAPETPGRKLALLYFLNSIGAVAGVLTGGFLLIPALGLPGTLVVAGTGNILLAGAVYLLGGGTPPRDLAPELASALAQPRFAVTSTRVLLLVAALTGLSSFIYEVVWIRMLTMVLGSATHSFEIMLASFILGLALGGWWIRARIDRAASPLLLLAYAQLAMGVLALLTLPLYNQTFDLMSWFMGALRRSDGGYILFNLALHGIALLVMFPAAFCAGMTLPIITRQLLVAGGERAIGQTYAANTVGSIAGVLVTVHLLLPLLGLKWSLSVGAAIDILLGVGLLLASLPGAVASRPRVAGALALSVLAAAAIPMVSSFDARRMASSVFRLGPASLAPDVEVVFSRDGKSATVQIVRYADGTFSLYTNGKSDGSLRLRAEQAPSEDEITQTLLAALPLAYRPEARQVALIGFGTGMTSAGLLASRALARLDTIEIEPAIVEGARAFLPVTARAHNDARHHVYFDDARSFLARTGRVYDVIVSEPSNPWVSGVSGLFTQEFYRQAARYLKPGGLFVQWVHRYEISSELLATIIMAYGSVYRDYVVFEGASGDLILVGSLGGAIGEPDFSFPHAAPLHGDLARLGFLDTHAVGTHRLASAKVFRPLYETFRAAPNSDFIPTVDLQGPRARFLRQQDQHAVGLRAAGFPLVDVLEGGVGQTVAQRNTHAHALPHRVQAHVAARQIGAMFGVGPAFAGEPIAFSASAASVVAIEAAVRGCRQDAVAGVLVDRLLDVAELTLPSLARVDTQRLWALLLRTDCPAGRQNPLVAWVTLIEAVARHDHAAMEKHARAILGPGLSARQRVFATQAIAASLLMRGRPKEVLAALDEQAALLPPAERFSAWFRLLASMAGDLLARPDGHLPGR